MESLRDGENNGVACSSLGHQKVRHAKREREEKSG